MSKTLVILALTVVLSIGAYGKYEEIQSEETIKNEAVSMLEEYDADKDNDLSENEQMSFVEDLFIKNGGNEETKQELETAVNEAAAMLAQFDTDGDGDLSHNEQVGLIQAVYEKYDNNEIMDENFKAVLSGYEKKVEELNEYHNLLDEVGVPGENIQTEIRKKQ